MEMDLKPTHCMVWSNLFIAVGFFPPHDFLLSMAQLCLCTVTFECLHEPLWSTMFIGAHTMQFHSVFILTKSLQAFNKNTEN